MTNPGDEQSTGDPAPPPADAAPIDAEIVDVTPSAPTVEDVTGYTAGGVPTFDHIRDKIERRTTTALGAEELAHETGAGQDTERRFAEREKAAKARLDEIRASLHRSEPDDPA